MASLSPANSFLSLKKKSSSSTMASVANSQRSARFKIKSLYNRVFSKQAFSPESSLPSPSSSTSSSPSPSPSFSTSSLKASILSINTRSQPNRTASNQNVQLPTPPDSPLLNFSSPKSSTTNNNINLNPASPLGLQNKNEKTQPFRRSKTLKNKLSSILNEPTKHSYDISGTLPSPSSTSSASSSSQITVSSINNSQATFHTEPADITTKDNTLSSELSRTLSNSTICSTKHEGPSPSMESKTKTTKEHLKHSFSFKQKLKISRSMSSIPETPCSNSNNIGHNKNIPSINTNTKKKSSKKAPKKMVTMTTMYPSRVEALKRERMIQQRNASLNFQTYNNGNIGHQIQQNHYHHHQKRINSRLGRDDVGNQLSSLNNFAPPRHLDHEIYHDIHCNKTRCSIPHLKFESIVEEDE